MLSLHRQKSRVLPLFLYALQFCCAVISWPYGKSNLYTTVCSGVFLLSGLCSLNIPSGIYVACICAWYSVVGVCVLQVFLS